MCESEVYVNSESFRDHYVVQGTPEKVDPISIIISDLVYIFGNVD